MLVFKDWQVLGLQILMFCCGRKPTEKLLMIYQIKNSNDNSSKWDGVQNTVICIEKKPQTMLYSLYHINY